MADSTPISPPAVAASNEPPISPIARQTTFPHKTSASVTTRTPFIDTSTPAINEAPVELDGLPASPHALAPTLPDEEALNGARKGSVVSPGLGEEDEIEAEFLGEGGVRASKEIQEVSPHHTTRPDAREPLTRIRNGGKCWRGVGKTLVSSWTCQRNPPPRK